MRKSFLIILIVVLIAGVTHAKYDVNDVLVRGDSTLMGMRIESSYFDKGAFLVETTGARFEYFKGQLKLYQGLKSHSRRLLSTIIFHNKPDFVKVESNEDHILFWSENVTIGIYGDSTLIVYPKVKQSLKFKGNFKPDYKGRQKGELLLIDELGGMEIYPQRYETGYKLKNIQLDRQDWIADYELNAGERVMIAAFPGRPFDWEKSFKTHFVVTTGQGNPKVYPFGQMPPSKSVKRWSEKFDIIAIQHNGLWKSAAPYGPYIPGNSKELKRIIYTTHKYNMKVVLHCSLFYFFMNKKDGEDFFAQVKNIYEKYGTDGVYIDGLTFDGGGQKNDDKILNWEMVRRLRCLFGRDGVIIYHGTSLGRPVATVPNIDTYCDGTLNGESVKIKSLDDPYLKFQVRKYGISNTVGFWDRYPGRPSFMSQKDVIDKILKMNCREFWNGYSFSRGYTYQLQYYREGLETVKQRWLNSSKADN